MGAGLGGSLAIHPDPAFTAVDRRPGWAKVLVIEDLSQIMPPEVDFAARQLSSTWGEEWPLLGSDELAAQRVSQAVDEMREATLGSLARLK
jgi:hypothetical protein